MEVAIRVDNIGKRYRIGQTASYKTLRDVVMNTVTKPFRPRAEKSSDFSHIWALRNISFEVGRGEVIGIIGGNGAGKSTILKILSRITEPSEGQAELYGRVSSLLEVGVGFHPELTGRENIYFNGAVLGMKRTEVMRKFNDIVDFSEIGQFLDTPVKHYSSGMYVRLAFSVAAHLDPDVLIVDEVLAVGDLAFQKKCLGKMNAVAGGGRTVFFVSHNLDAVRALCPRTILLNHGRMQKDGRTADVIDLYLKEENLTAASLTEPKSP